MRILHTSDWHLGKYLEGASRLEEQAEFIDDFVELVKERDANLIIIAGDIYDTSNPPAEAERLFYKAVKAISQEGKRMVLVIAGNHDHPERLEASSPIAMDDGIVILSKPKSVATIGPCGQHEIVDAGQGYIEVNVHGERAVILTMAYPSEKRLGELLYEAVDEEKDMQEAYSNRLGEHFHRLEEKFREDTINLAVSHLFTLGGIESSSERAIQLGGSYTVFTEHLPLKAQYIALGHLHKPQRIKNKAGIPIIYSGSPLPYSKSEISYSKCCYYFDAKAGQAIEPEKIDLKNYKPIEVWRCSSVQDALDKCEEHKERRIWVYLEIETDDFIPSEDIRQLKKIKKDIVEIKPIRSDVEKSVEEYDVREQPLNQMFSDFYAGERGVTPTKELVELFMEIVEEGEKS